VIVLCTHYARRRDYIADVQVVYTSLEGLPPGVGWELLTTTAAGSSAKLNKGGEAAFLAVRRVPFSAVDCPPAVCSLCVVLRSRGETAPPGYRVIERDLNKVRCCCNTKMLSVSI
jgi:hypothetical protein